MRFIILILLFATSMAFGGNIKCYSNGRMIYSGNGKGVIHDDGMFAFEEHPSKRLILISGDCVIRLLK